MLKVFTVAKKDGRIWFRDKSFTKGVTEIRMRAHIIGSDYSGCFETRKWFFYNGDEKLAIANNVSVNASTATFTLDGVKATATTKASQYGGYYMNSAFNQGTSWQMTTSSNAVKGTETIDIIITFEQPMTITRMGWENYTSTGRAIKDFSLFFNEKEVYRTPENKRNVYVSVYDIELDHRKNTDGGILKN